MSSTPSSFPIRACQQQTALYTRGEAVRRLKIVHEVPANKIKFDPHQCSLGAVDVFVDDE